VLAVWIDGTPEDAPVYAREADGTLWLSRDDLVRLGLLRPPRTDAPVAASDSAEVALAALTGLSYRFDPAEQRLDITSWAAAKRSNRIALGGDQADSRLAVPVSANTAALALNYDASARIDGDGTALAGLVEARLSLPHGAGLAAMRFGPDGRGGAEAVRLDSRFDLYDAGRDRIWRFGDTIAVGGANARAVRLGGVQLLGDFATRPDLVTRPLPGFAGQVAVPSALDLLVDGRRVGGGAGDHGGRCTRGCGGARRGGAQGGGGGARRPNGQWAGFACDYGLWRGSGASGRGEGQVQDGAAARADARQATECRRVPEECAAR